MSGERILVVDDEASVRGAVAQVLKEDGHQISTLPRVCSLRSCAMVARYGGEEFVMLLPETPKEGALVVAEKIRRRIEDHPFPGRDTQPDGKVTVSLGVVTFPQDGSNRGMLMQRADQALYQAKQDGRNRVCAGVES